MKAFQGFSIREAILQDFTKDDYLLSTTTASTLLESYISTPQRYKRHTPSAHTKRAGKKDSDNLSLQSLFSTMICPRDSKTYIIASEEWPGLAGVALPFHSLPSMMLRSG